MTKVQQKQKRAPKRMFNTEAVSRLAAKYGVSECFTRLAVNGARTSSRANEIKLEYNRIIKEVQKVIEQTTKSEKP